MEKEEDLWGRFEVRPPNLRAIQWDGSENVKTALARRLNCQALEDEQGNLHLIRGGALLATVPATIPGSWVYLAPDPLTIIVSDDRTFRSEFREAH